jgi:hypothetical protein
VKPPILIPVSFAFLTLSHLLAQEPTEVAEAGKPAQPVVADLRTQIIGHLADGSPPQQSPPLPALELDVLKSLTKPLVIEEPAPLPDMQPVRRTVTLTKNLIVEPVLQELPPLPPMDITDPAVIARMATMPANVSKIEIVFISATVFDHSRTLVKWWPNGRHDKEMCAWSNLDFNVFSGLCYYSWQGRKYALLLALGNESTAARRRMANINGRAYAPPEIPQIPADGPGFVITKGDATEPAALDLISSLHALYRIEEVRLLDAYAGRERARSEREAFLRANPPQPQDVTTWITEPRRIDVSSAQTPSK